MKLFCRDEMQRLEMAAVAAGVPLSQLMDNAGAAVAQEVERRCRPVGGKRAVVLCGKGNNGGDGFVCAKLLAQRGMACWVVLAQGKPATDLAAAAFGALPPQVAVLPGEELEQIRPVLEAADVLIDCVFGFSFRGELSGLPQKLLAYGSGLPCLKVSADLPSGVECDTGRVSAGAFRADVTVTFTGKKPANVSYPAKEFCGETVVRQVGVPTALVEGAGMAGACVMAAQAALRSGVGLLTIAVEERLYPILAQAVPQAVYVVLDWENRREESQQALLDALGKCTACVMGCGLGQRAELVCPLVFSHCQRPLVADADAVNFLSPAVRRHHPGNPVRPAGRRSAEGQGNRRRGGAEGGRHGGRRPGRPLRREPHRQPRHGQGRQRRRAGGYGRGLFGPGRPRL